jgi:hypothetical protein
VVADVGDGGESLDAGPTDTWGVSVADVAEVVEEADVVEEEDVIELAPCSAPDGVRPMRRSEHQGIYDPVGDRLVFHGGSLGVPVQCSFPTSTFENETWILDLRCNLWRKIDGGPPTGRTRHAAVYDSTNHRMVIFGGRYRAGTSGAYTPYGDVWAFDLETEVWSQVSTTAGPSARANAGVAYDPTGHRLIVFGGNASSSGMNYIALNDTWTLDLVNGQWSEVVTTGAPSPRLFQSALWDAARQRFIVHGGADEGAFFDTAQYYDEVYALDVDSGTWARLDDPVNERPAGRFWGGIVHDPMHDGYLLFGGHDDESLGNRNDLWSFDPDLAVWTLLEMGDTYNKPANGFCDFPPDFTNVAMDVPERRNAHIWVTGEKTVWLSGGKTDCGVVDDVMALDLETWSWTEVDTATVGVSCLRKGGLTCNDLCF